MTRRFISRLRPCRRLVTLMRPSHPVSPETNALSWRHSGYSSVLRRSPRKYPHNRPALRWNLGETEGAHRAQHTPECLLRLKVYWTTFSKKVLPIDLDPCKGHRALRIRLPLNGSIRLVRVCEHLAPHSGGGRDPDRLQVRLRRVQVVPAGREGDAYSRLQSFLQGGQPHLNLC